ncbi:MAG TPA: adenylate/guanylate cyclase domain-containing protein [Rhizomicrobium sp.]
MRSRAKSVAVWIVPLVVLAAALALIASDFGNLASGSRGMQCEIYQSVQAHAPANSALAARVAPQGASRCPAQAPEPVFSTTLELVFLAVAGLGLVALFAWSTVLWAAAFAIVAIVVAQSLSWLLFTRAHVLVDAASPNAALAAMFLSGLSARAIAIARMRAALKGTVFHRVPVGAINEIVHSPGLLKLDGERRVVTCMACGIRGGAALAESFAQDPSGFTRLIDRTMAPLIEEAVRLGAMIGPFDAEFFTAYWNAPLDDPEHAVHACETATRITTILANVNERLSHERRADGAAFEALEMGIGIATGPAITGGLTARGGASYSVTGECTGLARRIRALSAQYGPAVVVSEATREAASGAYAFLEVDFLAPAPGEQPVKLYAVLGNPLVRASPKFRALATFHDHIFHALRTQQWERTRELVAQCRKLSGASQKMYDLHLARIAWYEANPPGPDWDGAFRQPVM